MNRCVITPRARFDLKEIWLYIANDSVAQADRFADHLLTKAELIAEHPGMGTKRPDLADGVRGFPVDRRYLILYRSTDDGIEMLHIVHGARNLSMLGFA